MLVSEKSKKIMDACRFCWMCRHICPIGNVTGQERNNARARMLALSVVERGAEKLEDVADNVYECALCGACTKECVTGWDPVLAVKEVRAEMAMQGVTPDYILKLVENIQATGNIYGEKEISKDLLTAVKALPEKADTLLFIGKDGAYRTADKAVKAIEVLKKANVDFTVDRHEPDCGCAMDFLVGRMAETKEIAENCAKTLNNYKTVVVYDPADAVMIMREYKEFGIEIKAQVVTFVKYLSNLISDGKLKIKNNGKEYTAQDSYSLSRELEDSESVRSVLSACGKVKEMLIYGKDTMLAGNLIMNEYMPKVIEEVAVARWNNAKGMECKNLVTTSPAEYKMLSTVKPENSELYTVEEVVLQCL